MGHIWSQYQYIFKKFIYKKNIYIYMIFNKPINESCMYIIVFGKSSNLVTNGSFIMIAPLDGQNNGWKSNW
jgi:hypothetical protein